MRYGWSMHMRVFPFGLWSPRCVELSHRLNIYAYDAYIIGCAMNQRASILSLDSALQELASSLNIEVIEVKTV